MNTRVADTAIRITWLREQIAGRERELLGHQLDEAAWSTLSLSGVKADNQMRKELESEADRRVDRARLNARQSETFLTVYYAELDRLEAIQEEEAVAKRAAKEAERAPE